MLTHVVPRGIEGEPCCNLEALLSPQPPTPGHSRTHFPYLTPLQAPHIDPIYNLSLPPNHAGLGM